MMVLNIYCLIVFVPAVVLGIIKDLPDLEYDFIVVGGGTAGSVVASRLSENADHSVLVLEAGVSDRDHRDIHIPIKCATLTNSYIDWGFKSEPMKNACKEMPNRQSLWPTGKMLGGSSSHNFCDYIRGSRHDFDYWRDLGNEGWGYEDVLPYFKKSENNKEKLFADSPYHNTEGMWSIESSVISVLGQRIVQAAEEIGYKRTDVNGWDGEGFDIAQLNTYYGQRMSAASAFLWPVMSRQNLHVTVEAHVIKIIIENHVAVGVEYIKDGLRHKALARKEVILSAGALMSPKILMFSGVGPKEHLQEMGIDPVVDLPVGNNMEDHYMTLLSFTINESLSITQEKLDDPWTYFNYTFLGTGVFTTSGHQANSFHRTQSQPDDHKFPYLQNIYWAGLMGNSNGFSDLFKQYFGVLSEHWEPTMTYERGKYGFTSMLVHLHPRVTGTLRLRSNDLFDPPVLKLEYMAHPDDVKDMIEGVRLNMKLMESKTLQQLGILYEMPHHPGCKDFKFDTDAYWECFIRHRTLTVYHQTSTCKMATGKDGVVDNKLRVKGVKNLRVADASIMPHVTSGNTMSPTVMIGEKAADMIKHAHQ